jgi:hypothetical protein
MHTPDEETLIARATALVREHFELLSRGDLVRAKQQLFWPAGTSEKPIDVYLNTMRHLAPFQVVTVETGRFEGVRKKRHGAVATIWLAATVICGLGERSSDIVVWYFPETDQCLISARPTQWVLEKLKG